MQYVLIDYKIFQSGIKYWSEKLSETTIYTYTSIISRVLLVSRFINRGYYSFAPRARVKTTLEYKVKYIYSLFPFLYGSVANQPYLAL